MFEELMLLSNLRGWEGAGFIGQRRDMKLYTHKTMRTGLDLVHSAPFQGMVNDRSGNHTIRLLIGHTRWPTKGDRVIDNVHPHDFPNVIGVHNGTLSRVAGHSVPDGASDSRLLYEAFNEEDPIGALKGSTGAYALAWVDKVANTLNLVRNWHRPLWIAKLNVNKKAGTMGTLLFSSERIFLEFVLTRSNQMKNAELEEISAEKLYTFNLKDLSGIKEPKITALYPPFTSSGYSYGRSYGTWDDDDSVAAKTANTASTTSLPWKPGPKEKFSTVLLQGKTTAADHGGLKKFNHNKTTDMYLYTFADGHIIRSNYPLDFSFPEPNSPPKNGEPEKETKDEKKGNSVIPFVPKANPPKPTELESALLPLTGGHSSHTSTDSISPTFDDSFTEDDIPLFTKAVRKFNKNRRKSNGQFTPKEKHFGNSNSDYHETRPGYFVSSKNLQEYLQSGCSWCSNVVGFPEVVSEEVEIHWISPNEFICEDCGKEDIVQQYILEDEIHDVLDEMNDKPRAGFGGQLH